MSNKRAELKFQKHIIDSYIIQGGYARKWATQLAVGEPDLVATVPVVGQHLAEVKHRPDWVIGGTYKNPLTPKQKDEAIKFINGGGRCVALIVVGSTSAIGSKLVVCDPTQHEVMLKRHVLYHAGAKYDMYTLLKGHYDV